MEINFKELIIKAYIYVYAHKNFGSGVPDSEKIITIEDLVYEIKNGIVYCDVILRLKWSAAIKIQDLRIQIKESELTHFVEFMVNKYLE